MLFVFISVNEMVCKREKYHLLDHRHSHMENVLYK